MKCDVELIVARHEEDLRWLRRIPRAMGVSVYNKGGSPALEESLEAELSSGARLSVRPLANHGREAHSYLTHLVVRYDALAPVTVFAQGHPFDHAPDFHGRLQALANGREKPDPFLWYGFLLETDDAHGRRLFVPWSKNPDRDELSTGKLFEELFEQPSPGLFHFCGGGQFAVTREAVHRRPRVFYARALELSTVIPHAAHAMERLWDRFFGDPLIDPKALGREGVKYLKRVKRLEDVTRLTNEEPKAIWNASGDSV